MKKLFRVLLMVVIVSSFILSLVSVAAATEHDHDWKINEVSGDVHIIICTICSESRMESHTYGSANTCIICGFVKHEHDYQCKSFDAQFHTMACAICGYERTTTHTYTETCTVCGYKEHQHTWQYTQGENYDYNHGLHCTQCAATSSENHIYGNDGKCTVCGNSRPHEHQWEWDRNKSNYVGIHFLVCSCGASTSESHQLFAWDGQIGNYRGHSELCGICGFALVFEHVYASAYFNGERCTVCGYPGQGITVPETKPGETTPVETRPAESEPNETTPVETRPAESEPAETKPADPKPTEGDQDINDADDDHNNFNDSSTGNEQNSTGSKNESEKTDPKPENTQPTVPADDENTDHDDEIVDNTQPPTEISESGVTETPDEEEIASEVTVPEEPTLQKDETRPVVQDEHNQVPEAATPLINRASLMGLLAIVAMLTLAGFLTMILIKRLKK